jgi:acetyl/propionyl-CoA carboxylase alpha subunit
MTLLQFSDTPSVRHRTSTRPDAVEVDGIRVPVRAAAGGGFITTIDGRDERLQAAADGDAVYVQLRGRAWRLDKLDPTRGSGAAAAGSAGAALAPMPGVVISLHAAEGQAVRRGDPLLVIESMKLQMTIEAAADGHVVELPVAVGQSFQRGALLVRTAAEEGAQ